MSSLLVSVVIPAVRYDSFLDEAVESMLRQDFVSFEIVLVLDGVPAEARPWASDARVRIIQLPHRGGTPAALNAGIDAARGSYIARLDADDVALSGRLAAQATYLDSHPSVACVGSSVRLIDPSGVAIGTLQGPTDPKEIQATLLWRNCLVHSSVMYRRSAIVHIGGYNLASARMQDYELFLRFAREAKIAALDEPLTAYRVHPGQHSRRSSPWAGYTREVLLRRRELARTVTRVLLLQYVRDLAWFTVQVVRHARVVKPGYLRRGQS